MKGARCREMPRNGAQCRAVPRGASRARRPVPAPNGPAVGQTMIYWTRRLKCEVFVSSRVDLHYADAGTKRASIPSHFPNNAGAGRGGRAAGSAAPGSSRRCLLTLLSVGMERCYCFEWFTVCTSTYNITPVFLKVDKRKKRCIYVSR